jgi:sulfur-oxidizing protein SoxZ
MSANPTPRIRMPATAKAGEILEVKTLVTHEMESGQRKDKDGKTIPRKIIKQFTAYFNNREIMRVDLHPAISANPFQSFYVKATETGTFRFEWLDDDGTVYKAEQKVTVG